ncbi:MAG: acyl carrier protein [Azoarcus sp.]|jgi:acyl carrier protein|nr:acyl carrier protein [Azoarcus sp.]
METSLEVPARINTLQTEVAKILNVPSVELDLPLAQLGIDSLNVVELILVCQQVYPDVIDVSGINFDEHSTLREIDKCLLEASLS